MTINVKFFDENGLSTNGLSSASNLVDQPKARFLKIVVSQLQKVGSCTKYKTKCSMLMETDFWS